jgi:hypothetical protein
MWSMIKLLVSPVLFLLISSALAGDGYIHQKCTGITSCADCTNSVNNSILGSPKCIPILPAANDDPDTSGDNGTISCVSYGGFSSKYTMDFACNNGALSAAEKTQIADLKYNVKWAFYAYDAKAGDTLLQSMKIFENTKLNTRAVMGYDAARGFIVTSFRGSSNVMNWLSDFNFPKVPYVVPGCTNCAVHTGFLSTYNSLATQINEYLSILIGSYPGARIVVTGHSLGGAQAVLGAVDQQLQGKRVYLYTYGCPRVGDVNFANFVNGAVTATNIRAVYKNDPVPNAPTMDAKFRHSGTEIHFYSCSTYLADPAFGDDGQDLNVLYIADHQQYPCIATGEEPNEDYSLKFLEA